MGKGYKAFNENWKCRDYQYEVGKTYQHKGGIELCSTGFHFCKNLIDCFRYYDFRPETKIAEIEYNEESVKHGDDKSVTSEIKIIREIKFEELMVEDPMHFAINSDDWKEFKNTKVLVYKSKIKAWENSSVEAWGNSSVEARENSSVEAWGNSSVEARENSSVVAWGNSSVVARENSSVVARGNSSVVARGNSQILIPYSKSILIKSVEDFATIKDLSGDKPKIHVATDFEILKFSEVTAKC